MSGWGLTDALASQPKYIAKKVVFDATDTDIVSTENNTIVVRGFGFKTGDALVYTSAGTAIGGLTSGTTYYAIRVDSFTYKLAASLVNANAGTAISLTAVGDDAADTLQLVDPTLFGVDQNEIQANKDTGAATHGWVKTATVGSRKKSETLVAMSSKGGITTDAEDVEYEDFLISITTQPADDESATGEAVTFGVVAAITGTGGTLTYQWQLDSGSGFGDITDGGVYSDATTATLAISDNTGLDGNEYRCVVSATGADDVNSAAATLTEAA